MISIGNHHRKILHHFHLYNLDVGHIAKSSEYISHHFCIVLLDKKDKEGFLHRCHLRNLLFHHIHIWWECIRHFCIVFHFQDKRGMVCRLRGLLETGLKDKEGFLRRCHLRNLFPHHIPIRREYIHHFCIVFVLHHRMELVCRLRGCLETGRYS